MLFYRRSFCPSRAARQQAPTSLWRAPCRPRDTLQLECQSGEHLDAAGSLTPALSSPTPTGRVQTGCQHEHHPAAPEGSCRLQGPVKRADGQQEQLHRPVQHDNRITPSKLAGMSQLLGLKVEDMQQVLDRHSQLARLQPHQLASRLEALQAELGLNRYQTKLLVVLHGDMVATVSAAQLRARVQALAQHMKLPEDYVLASSRSIPSILQRRPQEVTRQLQRVAKVLHVRHACNMLRMAVKAPQLLTATPNCVSKRLQRMSSTLRTQPSKLLKGVHQQPDLLFLSPRILYHKVEILQCIFNRQLRLVVPMVMACPKLLRTNPDAVRASFTVLQAITGRDAGYSFGMVCHAPHLLLAHPQLLLRQADFIQQCASKCASWQAQLLKFSPAQLADCLALTAPTYARLIHLLERVHQADQVSLLDAITMPRSQFIERFPGTDVEQYLKERHRRGMTFRAVPAWSPPYWPDDKTRDAAKAAVAGPAGTWAVQSDKLRALRRQRSQLGAQALLEKYHKAGWLPGLGLVAKQMPAGTAGAATAQAHANGAAAQARAAVALAKHAHAADEERLQQGWPSSHAPWHPAAAYRAALQHVGHQDELRAARGLAASGNGHGSSSQLDSRYPAWHAQHDGNGAAVLHAQGGVQHTAVDAHQQLQGPAMVQGLGQHHQVATGDGPELSVFADSQGMGVDDAVSPPRQARTRRRAAGHVRQDVATVAPLRHVEQPQLFAVPDDAASVWHSAELLPVNGHHYNSQQHPEQFVHLDSQQHLNRLHPNRQHSDGQQAEIYQQAEDSSSDSPHAVRPTRELPAAGLEHMQWQASGHDQGQGHRGDDTEQHDGSSAYPGLRVPAHAVTQEALVGVAVGLPARQHVGASNGSRHVHTHVDRAWSNIQQDAELQHCHAVAQHANGWQHAAAAAEQQHVHGRQQRQQQQGLVRKRQLVHAAAGRSSKGTSPLSGESELSDSNDLAVVVA